MSPLLQSGLAQDWFHFRLSPEIERLTYPQQNASCFKAHEAIGQSFYKRKNENAIIIPIGRRKRGRTG
jgi:hypothetical protein